MGTIYWSTGSIMYINSRQMCALIFAGQRKCGAFGTVVPSAVLCVFVVVAKYSCTVYVYLHGTVYVTS